MRTNETAARERDLREPPEGRSAWPLACGNRQMWNSRNRVKLTARTREGVREQTANPAPSSMRQIPPVWGTLPSSPSSTHWRI